MKIGEICTRVVSCAFPNMTAAEAARLMAEDHVGDLVVVDGAGQNRTPVGIVTDRDLVLRVMSEGLLADQTTVERIMSRDLVTVGAEEGLYETVDRMRARGVRRVVVLDAKGDLVGVVSFDDVLNVISEELDALLSMLNREAAREKSSLRQRASAAG